MQTARAVACLGTPRYSIFTSYVRPAAVASTSRLTRVLVLLQYASGFALVATAGAEFADLARDIGVTVCVVVWATVYLVGKGGVVGADNGAQSASTDRLTPRADATVVPATAPAQRNVWTLSSAGPQCGLQICHMTEKSARQQAPLSMSLQRVAKYALPRHDHRSGSECVQALGDG